MKKENLKTVCIKTLRSTRAAKKKMSRHRRRRKRTMTRTSRPAIKDAAGDVREGSRTRPRATSPSTR